MKKREGNEERRKERNSKELKIITHSPFPQLKTKTKNKDGYQMTFLDTPGHAAFTTMREASCFVCFSFPLSLSLVMNELIFFSTRPLI